MRVDGNQTILVWHALASGRRHIRDMGPELEALVTIAAPRKSAMNRKDSAVLLVSWPVRTEIRRNLRRYIYFHVPKQSVPFSLTLLDTPGAPTSAAMLPELKK